MATTTANQQPIVPAKSGIKRTLVIAIGAIVLLGAGAGGTYFAISKFGSHAPAKAAPLPPRRVLPARIDDRQPAIRRRRNSTTCASASRSSSRDAKTQAKLTEHMPEIRSRVLLAPLEQAPRRTRDRSKANARSPTNCGHADRTADRQAGAAPVHVDDVLFTEFVVQ